MRGLRAIRVVGTAVLMVASWAPAGLARDVNYAFLVGVTSYLRTELKPLRYTQNDIVDFAEELQKTGFKKENIVVMHGGQRDPNRLPETKKIRKELDLLLSSVEEGDTVIVALAGHGVQFQGDNTSYFCPVDAVLEDRTTLIPLEDLYKSLDECAASRKLLLVDACRNDPQTSVARSRATVKLESVTRPQEAALPRGIAALFSCRPGQQSFEDEKLKHGVFFNFVLQGWKGAADGFGGSGQAADGNITLEELTEFVKEQTKTYTRLTLKKNQNPISRNETDDTQAWVLCRHGAERRSVEALFQRANDLRRRGRYDEAIEEFTRLIRTDPRFVKSYLGRGLCYAEHPEQPDYESASTDFREAIRREPLNVEALISLAGVHGRSGDHETAIKEYSQVIEIDPRRDDAYVGRGAALLLAKRLPEALIDLDKAIQIRSDNADAFFNRSMVRQRQGDTRGAAADFEKATILNPALARP